MLFEKYMYYNMLNVWFLQLMSATCQPQTDRKTDWPMKTLIVLGFTTRQPLRVILCRLPEKGRKKIEERVEEMKERDREERGTGMKVKKQKK